MTNNGYCNMTYTPDQLVEIQQDYFTTDIDKCPFCLSVAKKKSVYEEKNARLTHQFYCADCNAKWSVVYKLERFEMEQIPTHDTLKYEYDRLVVKAIDCLRSSGYKHVAERLQKLICGGYNCADV